MATPSRVWKGSSGMTTTSKTVRQCRSCPFKVSTIPSRDVPNYDPGIYDRMRQGRGLV